MNKQLGPRLSRRSVLAGTGALFVAFSMRSSGALAQGEEAEIVNQSGELPGSLSDYPFLDSWIRIGADDSIQVFTGKAELGQGIKTAITQIAAEQLRVALRRIELHTADTGQTPNEGFTAASHSMEESGSAILHAAADVRRIMLELASERLGVAVDELSVEDGRVAAPGGQTLSYGQLVSDEILHVRASGRNIWQEPRTYKIMGMPIQRVDIPGKLTGQPSYVQDLRLPGMLHARLIRPPRPGARLEELETSEVEAMPGVVSVVRDGDYLAVVAEGEYQAIQAMVALQAAARWSGGRSLPDPAQIDEVLRRLPADRSVIHQRGGGASIGGGRTIEATYSRPYQMHGSIGPSCAVGHYENGRLTVWSHTQGVYPDRAAISEMLGMPEEDIRVIHMEGAGCYGHNGADDAAADAAIIARAVPGRPVRVQWMREHEHQWEPYGSAMIVSARATLDGTGGISGWDYELWSTTHVTRPPPAANLLPAQLLSQDFGQPETANIPQPAGGADRNSVPPYNFPNARVTENFVREMPLRVSALRSLGAYMNVFAMESFIDELATEAGEDPVEFRLRYLGEERQRAVVERAAEAFGWATWQGKPGRGRGISFARYKNLAAYCAVALELDVERESGRIRIGRVVAASDSGEVVNPDGIRNQIEGGIVQSASWTLYEHVRFNRENIESRNWASYPIMRFPAAPESIEVHVIDRPGEPFLGTGEASQGPAAAAIANAFAHATGVRLRQIPFTRERVLQSLRA